MFSTCARCWAGSRTVIATVISPLLLRDPAVNSILLNHACYPLQEREAVEGSDRSRVSALEALNSKLTSELEDCKREQVL